MIDYDPKEVEAATAALTASRCRSGSIAQSAVIAVLIGIVLLREARLQTVVSASLTCFVAGWVARLALGSDPQYYTPFPPAQYCYVSLGRGTRAAVRCRRIRIPTLD
jgi:hypothetical protein